MENEARSGAKRERKSKNNNRRRPEWSEAAFRRCRPNACVLLLCCCCGPCLHLFAAYLRVRSTLQSTDQPSDSVLRAWLVCAHCKGRQLTASKVKTPQTRVTPKKYPMQNLNGAIFLIDYCRLLACRGRGSNSEKCYVVRFIFPECSLCTGRNLQIGRRPAMQSVEEGHGAAVDQRSPLRHLRTIQTKKK